ncbi:MULTISPECIES: DUF3809 domain-containing protein [Deinococcus]|uniref:DUF3809 domain-containing protein n=1 Tax=Deinococcus soli (ex Cha et al. 2016) TaxID=1309411 RepID=A0A0F7JLG8_9DEIO|nr:MULTISPECIES: DUF3809 domain-containing protein [Deinococcus]AKH17071.1 hypothetical protein SY84_08375 [Deinococcus soli (ex Cha et al. 2016)]MDK2012860.1 DUF3809 domain-containing protein [Deinococcus sp. 43]
MIVEATQDFTLPWAGDDAAALAFVRDPARALARVRFLRDLRADGEGVRGELLVPLPGLGEVDLPFHSALTATPDGGALTPQAISGERAWVEVAGQARLDGGALHFAFQFRAHLATPDAQGWGGAAFEKMIRAAAARTLERVARELPAGIAQAAQE